MPKIAAELKKRHPDIPLLVFPRGACYANVMLQAAGYDVVTMDCDTSVTDTRKSLQLEAQGTPSSIQGNLDPAILRTSQGR